MLVGKRCSRTLTYASNETFNLGHPCISSVSFVCACTPSVLGLRKRKSSRCAQTRYAPGCFAWRWRGAKLRRKSCIFPGFTMIHVCVFLNDEVFDLCAVREEAYAGVRFWGQILITPQTFYLRRQTCVWSA